MTLCDEVYESILNDMKRPQLCKLNGPIIENENHIHFEDILEKDRLNEDIDMHDGRIHQLLQQIQQLDEDKYTMKISQAYINQIKDSSILIKMHMDGGANRSVTNDPRLLHNIKTISPYPMNGAQSGPADIICTKKGYLRLLCDGRGVIEVEMYYSPNIAETIISPGDITEDSSNNFDTWHQYSNHNTREGYIQFSSSSGLQTAKVKTIMKTNRLWYVQQSLLDCINPAYKHSQNTPTKDTPIIRKLSAAVMHELWHQRLCHPGKTVTENIHLTAEGVPMLAKGRHELYKCRACERSKMQSVSKSKQVQSNDKIQQPSVPSRISQLQAKVPGQLFHMDFGFVRGSDYKRKDKSGKLITSIDGYRSYLIIVDSATGYMWVLLTKTKDPPLQYVRDFLSKHGNKQCQIKGVRTDQGGELWKSKAFRAMIHEEGYLCEPTGAGDPAQNGKAEAPNKSLARMMRGMLFSAGLGSEYWSYAMLHAVYVKNRSPHSCHQFKLSPYEALTGTKPNLCHLRVWGCRVIVKQPNPRSAKLDSIAREGIFLRYTATNKNIVYIDIETQQEKIGSHVRYDEANFLTGSENPGATALRQAGNIKHKQLRIDSNPIQIVKKHSDAILPTRATAASAGLDIATYQHISIPPGEIMKVPTGISIALPQNTCGRLLPRSGNTVKKMIDVKGGVIDADYTGEIIVILHNFGKETQDFQPGERIAQLVIETIDMSTPTQWTHSISPTERGENGFGNSDASTTLPLSTAQTSADISHPPPQLYLSSNPYGPTITVECKIKGNHPTLGLELDSETQESRLILTGCQKGTPAAKISRWRSTLRGAVLQQIGHTTVETIEDVTKIVESMKLAQQAEVQLTFLTVEKVPIHTQQGIPQLFHDQLNILAKHHQELREEATITASHISPLEDDNPTIAQVQKQPDSPKKLTRRYLKQCDDWEEWKDSEAKQLNQYHQQGMFSNPQPKPNQANILYLLWTYLLKKNGVKKARCCCNGNPGRQGSITLDHTYAACVEQPAQRVFWAITALKNYIAVGADASNAFAEAPPPKAPLYVYVDQPFREWWQASGKGVIPKGHVLKVNHAIQGHPEAPRLWSNFIDDIIQNKLGLKPTTHEPCLYRGYHKGKEVIFLRQVDDFAISAADETTCNEIIDKLDKHLKEPIKNEGIISSFNGTEVQQTDKYIKIHNTKYIEKILKNHGWLEHMDKSQNRPIPMRNDTKYTTEIEISKGPENAKEQAELEQRMGFSYRQAIGELLYAMVTCRPDISIAVTKLSQYSNQPAEIHYKAVKNVFRFLRATKSEGLHYWKSESSHSKILPMAIFPKIYTDKSEYNKNVQAHDLQEILNNMYGFVDSDWAGDVKHRHSVSGIAIFLAGAVIAYKSKFQKTIALSSTEAEFSAACEAGKIILYLRSILEDLDIEQEAATTLYEDNMGALMMANAGQPTRRTRHIETTQFALLDWVKRDLLHLEYSSTTNNCSDALTKPLARVLFHKHMDRLMGRIVPPIFRLPQNVTESTKHTPLKDDVHAANVNNIIRMGGVSYCTCMYVSSSSNNLTIIRLLHYIRLSRPITR